MNIDYYILSLKLKPSNCDYCMTEAQRGREVVSFYAIHVISLQLFRDFAPV